ncbi:MAG: hypothetical protein A4E65_00224 [Syntrophorhabdus sp. PtaU1.Bin153]|nr:MAG: hypothetical protein A4E65_00224 [Syntrophorhabdus sp. PtaU1.Bin153]
MPEYYRGFLQAFETNILRAVAVMRNEELGVGHGRGVAVNEVPKSFSGIMRSPIECNDQFLNKEAYRDYKSGRVANKQAEDLNKQSRSHLLWFLGRFPCGLGDFNLLEQVGDQFHHLWPGFLDF